MTKKSEPAEVVIAEATGHADNGGPILSRRIEDAMGQAVLAVMAQGIADDTPAERVEELLGVKGKTGADIIREAKLASRGATRKAWHSEQEALRAATAAVLSSEGQAEG